MQLVCLHPETPGAIVLAPILLALTALQSIMATYQAPTKEQVREYLKRRLVGNAPVPSISEIRNELGWIERTTPEDKPACESHVLPQREDSTA